MNTEAVGDRLGQIELNKQVRLNEPLILQIGAENVPVHLQGDVCSISPDRKQIILCDGAMSGVDADRLGAVQSVRELEKTGTTMRREPYVILKVTEQGLQVRANSSGAAFIWTGQIGNQPKQYLAHLGQDLVETEERNIIYTDPVGAWLVMTDGGEQLFLRNDFMSILAPSFHKFSLMDELNVIRARTTSSQAETYRQSFIAKLRPLMNILQEKPIDDVLRLMYLAQTNLRNALATGISQDGILIDDVTIAFGSVVDGMIGIETSPDDEFKFGTYGSGELVLKREEVEVLEHNVSTIPAQMEDLRYFVPGMVFDRVMPWTIEKGRTLILKRPKHVPIQKVMADTRKKEALLKIKGVRFAPSTQIGDLVAQVMITNDFSSSSINCCKGSFEQYSEIAPVIAR